MAGYQSTTTSQDQEIEHKNVEILTQMMGSNIDPEVARRILRKCDGDVHKAATAILEGDRGEAASSWSAKHTKPPVHPDRNQKAPTPTSVIDLTTDEDDMTRALEASMQPQETTNFGPSDRVPSSDWAMVPSNVATSSVVVSHDDHSLNRAIEESLSSSYNDLAADAYEDLPIEKSVREGGRPVALRPNSPALTYAALLLQCLFAVPQIRQCVAAWRQSEPVEGSVESPQANDSEGQPMCYLVELFANTDLAQLSAIVPDQVLETFRVHPWGTATITPGTLTSEFYRALATMISNALQQQLDDEGLQGTRYSRIDTEPSSDVGHIHGDCIVNVETGDEYDSENDLVSRLTAILSRYHEKGSNHDVIVQPSDVIAFHLKNSRPASSSTTTSTGSTRASSSQKYFKFPKTLYLDQFISENFNIADAKRRQQMEISDQIQKLIAHRNSITRFNGNDTLKSLRATLYYYEIVAEAKGNADRQAYIDDMAVKMRKILEAVENNIELTDKKISELKAFSETLFDCPELQNFKYDLRAVIGHDGLFGRRQLHSYVKDKGLWWKCVDMDVTEVSEETVLTDSTGVHLGGGPYLLIYSSALPDDDMGENMPLPWIKSLKDRVKFYNREFLSSLDPAIVAKAQPLYSPPSSPELSATQFILPEYGENSRSSSVEEIIVESSNNG